MVHHDDFTKEIVIEEGEEEVVTEDVLLATLETLVMDPKEADTKDLSHNAMVGTDAPRTMKVMGTIEDRSIVVLIDNSASHNFIDEELVNALNLPRLPTTSYGILLGTGKSVQTTDICKGVVLNLVNLTIIDDFIPLSLGSANVILGVQWLMMSGKVEYDWSTSKMEFHIGEWKIQLKGDLGLVKTQISLKSMIESVQEEGHGLLVELNTVEVKELGETTMQEWKDIDPAVQGILQQHASGIEPIHGLPPTRNKDCD